LDLAGRWAIAELDGEEADNLEAYTDQGSERYRAMLEVIRERLGLTSLRYQRLDDLVAAIGMPKEKLCTYCWDGVG
jgi:amidophosphoribosyltransferase